MKKNREHWPGHSKEWAIGTLISVGVLTAGYALGGGIVVSQHANTVWNQQVAAAQVRNANAFWRMVAGQVPPSGVPGQLARILRAQAARPGETVVQQLNALTRFRALENQFPGIDTRLGPILSYQPYSCGSSTCYIDEGPLTWEAIAETLAATHGDLHLVQHRVPPVASIGRLSYTYYGYSFAFPAALAAVLSLIFFSTARIRLRTARQRKAEADRAYYNALPEPAKRLYVIKRTLQIYLDDHWDDTANTLLKRVTKDLDQIIKDRTQIEDAARWADIENQITTNEALNRTYAETLREIT